MDKHFRRVGIVATLASLYIMLIIFLFFTIKVVTQLFVNPSPDGFLSAIALLVIMFSVGLICFYLSDGE